MRYLIISDIHGNRFGLEAVLEHARGAWDKVICLGDVVGYGAHPNECCEMVREVEAHVVMGNHDGAALGFLKSDSWNDVDAIALEWTRQRLTRENWVWLYRATEAQEISGVEGDLPFFITHGNLEEPFYETYILNAADAFDELERLHERKGMLCFFGHTHCAVVYRCELPFHVHVDIETHRMPQGGSFTLHSNSLYLVNPGSCGQPRDGNPQARYALFDAAKREVEIRCVDYDVEAARNAIYQANLPFILGDRLLEAW